MSGATHGSQARDVLRYMKRYGSITQKDAVSDLGNYRLSDSIFRLREQGHEIDTHIEKSKNRFGRTVRYARYRLAEGKERQC